jgi:lipopolysaccharide transport system permease protein
MRDIKVRYKQTILGSAWAILQPLTMMLVFTLFFRRMAGGGESAVPYPIFVLTGLLAWIFFSSAVTAGGQSVISSQNLVSKVYFPRLVLPLSSIGAALFDLAVASVVLVPLMVYYKVGPGWGLWLLPATVVGLTCAALGIGAMLTALTISFRDFRFVIPFMIQVWMFATPALYMQADSLPLSPRFRAILALNPVQGLIVNLRAALLGLPPDYPALVLSLAISAILLLVGCAFFHRQERYFADIV